MAFKPDENIAKALKQSNSTTIVRITKVSKTLKTTLIY